MSKPSGSAAAPRKRRTAKERVLAAYPKARECYSNLRNLAGIKVIGIGLRTILGTGNSWRAAWADAASRLTKGASRGR